MTLSTLLFYFIGGNLADYAPSSIIRTVGSCLEKPDMFMLNFLASSGKRETFICRNFRDGVV